MSIRPFSVAVAALTLVACASALPPNRVPVKDLQSLAGTYTGDMNEKGELNRSARLVLHPDGTFELAVSDPKGFRTGGKMTLLADGTLAYQYNEMLGRGLVDSGMAAVYEGDGRRAIVLTKSDGSITTTVSKSLP